MGNGIRGVEVDVNDEKVTAIAGSVDCMDAARVNDGMNDAVDFCGEIVFDGHAGPTRIGVVWEGVGKQFVGVIVVTEICLKTKTIIVSFLE